jgi:Tfp pilus assembly protein PilO
MSRHHIITALAFVLVVGTLAAVYQFYFREKLEAYAKAKQEMTQLANRLTELNGKFHSTHPQVYLPAVKGAVRPFQEAASQRAQVFNMRDMWVAETVPEDQVTMAKFYYGDKWNEKFQELWRAAYPQTQIPQDLFTSFFQVPAPEELADMAVPKEEVETWLTKINFGSAIVRMLIEAKAVSLFEMVMWDPRNDIPVLDMYTIGLGFYMTADDLTNFLDKLRNEPRYFTVEAIRIQNQNLMTQFKPYLQVEMLLTMARYREDKAGQAGAVAPAGTGVMPAANPFGGLFTGSLATVTPSPRRARSGWSRIWETIWPFD